MVRRPECQYNQIAYAHSKFVPRSNFTQRRMLSRAYIWLANQSSEQEKVQNGMEGTLVSRQIVVCLARIICEFWQHVHWQSLWVIDKILLFFFWLNFLLIFIVCIFSSNLRKLWLLIVKEGSKDLAKMGTVILQWRTTKSSKWLK